MKKKSTNKVATFGEILMRLSPADNRKIQQSHSLDFFFGGTELNVAASLSKFGMQVSHISSLPTDFLGEAALASIRQFGIDTSHISFLEQPIGIYFLEEGSGMRSSQASYNRLHGCFANISPDRMDWEKALDGKRYFHWTGISPAVSEGAYQTLKKGLEEAGKRNMIVTTDPAYRKNLWQYGRQGQEVLADLVARSTLFIGGVNEINEILGTGFDRNREGFIAASKELIHRFPKIESVYDKVRKSHSASWQQIYGRAWTGSEYLQTPEYEITHVIDRIGSGDAYAAGLIYGLDTFKEQQRSLEFATAACALKHTIVGDTNLVSEEEVLEVVRGDSGGRIKR